MKSYSAREIFTPGQQLALDMACGWVERLPEERIDQPLRCHEVARVIHVLLQNSKGRHGCGSHVIDGRFGPVEHSWIILGPSGLLELDSYTHTGAVILDTYCVARLPMVQLVHAHMHFADLYRPGSGRNDLRMGTVNTLLAEVT